MGTSYFFGKAKPSYIEYGKPLKAPETSLEITFILLTAHKKQQLIWLQIRKEQTYFAVL